MSIDQSQWYLECIEIIKAQDKIQLTQAGVADLCQFPANTLKYVFSQSGFATQKDPFLYAVKMAWAHVRNNDLPTNKTLSKNMKQQFDIGENDVKYEKPERKAARNQAKLGLSPDIKGEDDTAKKTRIRFLTKKIELEEYLLLSGYKGLDGRAAQWEESMIKNIMYLKLKLVSAEDLPDDYKTDVEKSWQMTTEETNAKYSQGLKNLEKVDPAFREILKSMLTSNYSRYNS